jgi:hypothetical protein
MPKKARQLGNRNIYDENGVIAKFAECIEQAEE